MSRLLVNVKGAITVVYGVCECIIYVLTSMVKGMLFTIGIIRTYDEDDMYLLENYRRYDNGDMVVNNTQMSKLKCLRNMIPDGYKSALVRFARTNVTLLFVYSSEALEYIEVSDDYICGPTIKVCTTDELAGILDKEDFENLKQYKVFLNRMLY